MEAKGWIMVLSKAQLPITLALVCLLVGNLLDAICTLFLLESRIAYEANPIMAHLYQVSPVAFMLTKVCMTNGSVLVAAFIPDQRAKRAIIRFGAMLYLFILLYEGTLVLRTFLL